MANAEGDHLDRIESLLEQLTTDIRELKTEIKETQDKWDERFFQLARDTKNIALGLIVSAVVTVIITSVLGSK